VVTDGKGALDGSWSWKTRIRENLPPSFDRLNLTLSGANGALSWTFEADSSPGRGANAGWRDIWDGTGTVIERRDEDMTVIEDNVSLSGSLAWKPASGLVANLNVNLASEEFDQKQISKTFPVGGPGGRRFFYSSEDEWNGELGGDIEFGAEFGIELGKFRIGHRIAELMWQGCALAISRGKGRQRVGPAITKPDGAGHPCPAIGAARKIGAAKNFRPAPS